MKPPPIPAINPLLSSLPAKFQQLRAYQIPAIMNILEAFEDGIKVVVLDAPTGSGKTIIAETTRLMLETRGIYVAHNKDLQQQFARDFPYSEILYGRANYQPVYAALNPGATCADCPGKNCTLCPSPKECTYQLAKLDAFKSPVPVLNMAYWLNETKAERSMFSGRGLTVVDEADVLESVLMGQVEVSVSPRMQRLYDISPPSKMTKEESHVAWGKQTVELLVSVLRGLDERGRGTVAETRQKLSVDRLLRRVSEMVQSLESGECGWVYTGGAGSGRRRGDSIEFKPVEVRKFGRERIWGNDARFLLMSGSVVSPNMLLEGLGWDGDFHLVSVESQFPVKNRQVVVKSVADMTRKGQEEGSVDVMVRAVEKIAAEHPDERILVHTVSFKLAEALYVEGRYDRPIFTYSEGRDRPAALQSLKNFDRAMLFAASMDRGIDLPDELCRVQIIAKVPFPYLGDKQVAARLYNTRDGELWYNVQVARTVLQMAGRGVRHVDDYCSCYVLDSSFRRWYARWQQLLPKWFRMAVRFE